MYEGALVPGMHFKDNYRHYIVSRVVGDEGENRKIWIERADGMLITKYPPSASTWVYELEFRQQYRQCDESGN